MGTLMHVDKAMEQFFKFKYFEGRGPAVGRNIYFGWILLQAMEETMRFSKLQDILNAASKTAGLLLLLIELALLGQLVLGLLQLRVPVDLRSDLVFHPAIHVGFLWQSGRIDPRPGVVVDP